jgi:excisionase family DNA binding protein
MQTMSTASDVSDPNRRLLRFLSATAQQREAIDQILSGQLSLDALAPRAPEVVSGPLLLRVKDAAALLGVHRATIWRLVKAGRLETVPLLGSLRVRRADIEALAAGKTLGSGARTNGKDAK